MHLPLFQIDAFATQCFRGNPAAVMPLEEYLPDAVLQAIAAENNLSETAFLVRDGEGYRIRWFTPALEVPLCGHATLASAAVVMERLERGRSHVVFHSASGPLTVMRAGASYIMNFPARPAQSMPTPAGFADALGAEPVEVFVNVHNYMVLLSSASVVRKLTPNLAAVARIDRLGIIVTAPGDAGYDCVSRYFAPAKGIPEDPVTGGAHCMLVPYWCQRLGKSALRAYQASARGGELHCRALGDRVELAGSCVFYLEGTVEI
jgi:PhzF family phenazine biosynthesis protein